MRNIARNAVVVQHSIYENVPTVFEPNQSLDELVAPSL